MTEIFLKLVGIRREREKERGGGDNGMNESALSNGGYLLEDHLHLI